MSHHRLVESADLGAFSYSRLERRSETLDRDVRFGRALPRGLKPEEILATAYVLHGGNGDDRQPVELQMLEKLSERLGALFEARKIQLVFPWIGTSFLRSPGHSEDSDWFGYFTREVLAQSEAGTRTETRWILGYSMGGQTALNVFLRGPERFAGVGAHFPTLVDFDYRDAARFDAFVNRFQVGEPYRKILLDGFVEAFVSRDHFLAHDPLELSRRIDPSRLNGRSIAFDVGSADEFGLQPGVRELHRVLTERSIAHRFEEVEQGHHDAAFVQAQVAGLFQAVLAPGSDLGGAGSKGRAEPARHAPA